MKQKKILSLLLSLVTAAGLFSATMVGVHADEEPSTNTRGMVINKTATVGENGGFDITLEAYATGESVITSGTKDVPTDIVLVIDQSGSMKNCIICGANGGQHYTYTYTAVDNLESKNEYYIKNGNTYVQVTYCYGIHWQQGGGPGGSRPSNTNCAGGEGWYVANGQAGDHTATAKITDTQFYKRTVNSVEECTSRLSSLKTAVTAFVNSVNEKAKGADGDYNTADDVNHRIAIVGFASGSGYGNNTELLSITGTNSVYTVNDSEKKIGIQYNNELTVDNYKDVLQDMNTEAGTEMVNNAISALAAQGATSTDLGVTMAEKVFENNTIAEGEERNRVVIVFSDGAPTTYDGFSETVANKAIEQANTIKTTYDAKVYAVGVFAGADHTSAGTEPTGDLNNNSNSINSACNWFMQNLSSNNGTVQATNSYYLSAGDSTSLNNIFQQIANNIEENTTTTTLDENTVIKDIIAPQFQLPAGATAENITLETYACTGIDDNGAYMWNRNVVEGTGVANTMGASVTVSGDKVDVTGFNFKDNFVGTITENDVVTGYRGNKLVIKFNVQTKDGFLGGNDVYTNTSAGVYENANATEPVWTFPRPTVNVPIQDVTVTAEEKNVYLLGDLTAEQIKSGAKVTCGNVELKLDEDNYGLESWQNAYVDIGELKIVDNEGNKVDINKYQDLKDDTTYRLALTITPKTYGKTPDEDGNLPSGTPNDMAGKTGRDEGNINVFKPELTYKDSVVYNGQTAPTLGDYNSTNYDSTKTVWNHTDGETETLASAVTMIGTAPTLSFEYTPDASQISDGKINATDNKIGVAVTVKIDTTDVTSYTKFNHAACSLVTNCPTLTDSYKFWLHILNTDLTITKIVDELEDDQCFVFEVDLGDGTKLEVVFDASDFNGNIATKTIKGVKVGQSCTVTEITDWSWRYEVEGKATDTKTLVADKTENVFTFKNKLTKTNWLDGNAYVENKWDLSNKEWPDYANQPVAQAVAYGFGKRYN